MITDKYTKLIPIALAALLVSSPAWAVDEIDNTDATENAIESVTATGVETTAVETAEVETTEVETAEVEITEVETTEVETAEVETAEVETAEVETAAVETAEATEILATGIATIEAETAEEIVELEATEETIEAETTEETIEAETTEETIESETAEETVEADDDTVTVIELEAIVEGFVFNEAGEVIADVEITIGDSIVTSDDKGYYQIIGLSMGTYSVTAIKEGYVFQEISATLDDRNPTVTLNLISSISGDTIEGANLVVIGEHQCDIDMLTLVDSTGQLVHQFATDLAENNDGVRINTADFDADGSVDITISENGNGDDISIYNAEGKQTFKIISNGNGKGVNTIFGDIDGDGSLEIIVANQGKDTKVSLYQADGSAIRAINVFETETKFNIAAGDVNGDGNDEIIIAIAEATDEDQNNIFVYSGEGDLLSEFSILLNGTSFGMVVAVDDVNGDDIAEIVVGQTEGYVIGIYSMEGEIINSFDIFLNLAALDIDINVIIDIDIDVNIDDDSGSKKDDDSGSKKDDDSGSKKDDDSGSKDDDSRSSRDSRSSDKVNICHNGNVIEVDDSALDAHLDHGDTLGTCENDDDDSGSDANIAIVNIVNRCDINGQGLVLALGDIDGDGQAEIIVSKAGGNEVRIYTAEGTLVEQFTVENSITSVGFATNLVVDLPVITELDAEEETLENITVIGTVEKPVLVENRVLSGTVRFAHTLIGSINVTTGSRIIYGPGVRFTNYKFIPFGAKLTPIFPVIRASTMVAKLNLSFEPIDLSISLIEGEAPVIDDIAELLSDSGFEIEQNNTTGNIEVTQDDVAIEVCPVEVTQAAENEEIGIKLNAENSVIIITQKRQRILAHPVVQDFTAFVNDLESISLKSINMSSKGTLHASTNVQIFHTGRAALSSIVVDVNLPLGGTSIDSPYLVGGNNLLYALNFKKHNRHYQQIVYPSPIYPEILLNLGEDDSNATNVSLQFDGLISFILNGQSYRAMLGYDGWQSEEPASGAVEFIETGEDINDDGVEDFTIAYPDGNMQDLIIVPTEEAVEDSVEAEI